MRISDKQLLRIFIVLTMMPLITMVMGSFINLALSWVFMCQFAEIQLSVIWFFHCLVGLFFTIALLSE
jgi:cell division protein FtsW (lipid II flippase)